MNRKGYIAKTKFTSPGVLEYLNFIQKLDKIEKWQDLAPLTIPLKSGIKSYTIPWDIIKSLSNKVYGINDLCQNIEHTDQIAPILGLRYSYLRMEQLGAMLDVVESFLASIDVDTNTFIEPGCFTGGFLNYLAIKYPWCNTIGFDVSPVSLDVAAELSKSLKTSERTHWLEADFGLVRKELIEEFVDIKIKRPVVFISNFISYIGRAFEYAPCIDKWHVEIGLISYWVNQGAIVIISERNDTPNIFFEKLVKEGRWSHPKTKGIMLKNWIDYTTMDMTKENPTGEWLKCRMCVLAFYRETND
jgi:hypothetical protein